MLQAVAAGGLLVTDRPVIVLVSGGCDSTCLLDVAVRIAGRQAVTALHVNYGLRQAAEGDERHCEQLCEHLGVPLQVRRTKWPESGNLQAWARDQRYGAAASAALARGGDVGGGPHRGRSGRDDPVPAGLVPQPSRAAGDAAA